jgi:hypothetical protein
MSIPDEKERLLAVPVAYGTVLEASVDRMLQESIFPLGPDKFPRR